MTPRHLALVGVLLGVPGTALAAAPAGSGRVSLPEPARVGVRAVGEALRDTSISEVYGDTSVGGEVTVSVPLPFQTEVALLAGYRRFSGTSAPPEGEEGSSSGATWMWLAPVSAVGRYTASSGGLTLLGGLGPSVVLWSESPGQPDGVGTQGSKAAMLVEVGGRTQLGRSFGEIREEPTDPRALELEAVLGYRWALRRHGEECGDADVCGLDLSALRFSLGLQARF